MIRAGGISHPNEIIDKKVKAFYDYFHYSISRNRDVSKYDLENHLTLLEKIILRAQKFGSHPSSVWVIKHYLHSHSLLDRKNDRFSRKGKIAQKLKEIKTICSKEHKQIDFEQVVTLAEEAVTLFHEMLHKEANSYFQGILYNLIGVLGCEHDFEEHKDEIIYYSKLLAVEYLRAGFEIDELDGNNGVFNKILSTTIQPDPDNPLKAYVGFPITKRLEEKRGSKEFVKEVTNYLENRTFVEQFEGLYTIYNREYDGTFVYKIDNISVSGNKKLNVEFDEVTFFHPDNLGFDLSEWDKYEKEQLDAFIPDENGILASVDLAYKSLRKGGKVALYKIRNSLGLFHYRFGGRGHIQTNKVYVFKGKGARYSWEDKSVRGYNHFDEEVILMPNKSLSESVKKFIHSCDIILFRAFGTEFWDDEILYFWRYLERVFNDFDYDMKEKGRKIIKNTAKVFFLSEKSFLGNSLRLTIANILINSDKTVLSLSDETRLKMRRDRHFFDDIEKLRGLAQYDFWTELFGTYDSLESEVQYAKYKDFYGKVLNELYEQRNTILHQGDYCFSTIENLQLILPSLFKRFRTSLVKFANENPEICEPKALLEGLLVQHLD